jgi:hypothetical protein
VLLVLAAVVAGVALLQRGGALDTDDADAVVVLELAEGVGVDAVRQDVAQHLESTWDARQVGEASGEGDDEVTLTMALPGSNLSSAIAWLRRSGNSQVVRETVDYSVDPDQVDVVPMADSEAARRPEPVMLQVRVIGDEAGPSSAMTVGALLLVVATTSAALLAWWWFRTERN